MVPEEATIPVRLNSSGGGSVTLDVPSTGSAFNLTLPAANGNLGINLATAQNSTSGTAIDFTGIPAGVRRVTVMFNGVSTNGSTRVLVQLGTSAGFVTTGYLIGITSFGGGTLVTTNDTSGFATEANGSSLQVPTASRHGAISVEAFGGNVWVGRGNIGQSQATFSTFFGGTVALPGTLDRVRITTVNGTDIFDAGSINVAWEF